MKRKEAREQVVALLFETEFKKEEAREEIFALSVDNREVEDDAYIKTVYFGVGLHQDELDELINKHAKGWKVTRISRVSRSILRLAIFEMRYLDDVPSHVAINEAVELTKKFDEESARAFVNGVLNSVKNELFGSEAENEK